MGGRYRAIFRDGKLLAEYEGGELVYLDPEYRAPARSDLAMPMVIRDIGEYVSPIDGTAITSRNQHRDHMRAHGVVEVGNERIGSLSPQVDTNTRPIGEQIKRRLEEVKAMPSQAEYDAHVKVQQMEHAAIAALATP